MVNATLLITTISAAAASSYSWTKCINVKRCTELSSPGPYGYAGRTSFVYNSDNHDWYSERFDGLYVSHKEYFNPARDGDILDFYTKGKHFPTFLGTDDYPCCLPDELVTSIDNVVARST